VSFLARLATIFIAIWAVLRLLRFLVVAKRAAQAAQPGGAAAGERARRPSAAGPRAVSRGRMVRDRVCGTHIPLDRALTLEEDGETLYFCGAKCRDAHLGGGDAGSAS
jgi:YHS domain-containing protein